MWLAAATVTLAVAVVGVPLYVLPASDGPAPVDVIYVIGPPTDARMEMARGMIADGDVQALMVSLDPAEDERWPEAARFCGGDGDLPPDVLVLCERPDPFTTRGEARELEEEMERNGWDSAAVITFTPHVSRARMIMERCDTGEVAMIDSGEDLDAWYWAYHYAYQTAGFAKALILHGC